MKELVEVIAKALVDDPESVTVNERTEKKTTILEVRVADSDMGESNRKTGTYCQGYPFSSKSSGSEGRQESDCRYSGLIRMDIGTDRVLPGLSLFMKKEMCPPEQGKFFGRYQI